MQQTSNFLELTAGRCRCDSSRPLSGPNTIGETAEELATLMHKTLQGMEQEAKVKRCELDTLRNNFIIQEMAEKITQRLRTGSRTNRRVATGELVNFIKKS